MPYYLLHGLFAYYTESNLKNCNNAQKQRKNSKYAPAENFCGHFCPRQKAANFCHPVLGWGTHYSGDIDDDDVDVVRGEVF